jgi:hypothetical protein
MIDHLSSIKAIQIESRINLIMAPFLDHLLLVGFALRTSLSLWIHQIMILPKLLLFNQCISQFSMMFRRCFIKSWDLLLLIKSSQ